MSSEEQDQQGDGVGVRTPLTRRDFLKTAGVAGAALGVCGGLGGVARGLRQQQRRRSGGGSAATAARSRSASSRRSPARSPRSARPTSWCVKQWKAAVKDGLKCGDGQTHPIKIIIKDTQSDTNRAATVAGDLITNDGFDIMMAASTPDTVTAGGRPVRGAAGSRA